MGIAYIQSASTHFGSKLCSANPEVSLVLVSDELHHEFTGLLEKIHDKLSFQLHSR